MPNIVLLKESFRFRVDGRLTFGAVGDCGPPLRVVERGQSRYGRAFASSSNQQASGFYGYALIT